MINQIVHGHQESKVWLFGPNEDNSQEWIQWSGSAPYFSFLNMYIEYFTDSCKLSIDQQRKDLSKIKALLLDQQLPIHMAKGNFF